MKSERRPKNPEPDFEAFLYQSINETKSYHDQKERMAWLGLVLYAVTTAANNVGFQNIEQAILDSKWVFSGWRLVAYFLYSVVVAIVFARFIMQQQRLRVIAAGLVDASKAATIEMLRLGKIPEKLAFDRTRGQKDQKYSMLIQCPDCIYVYYNNRRESPLHGLVWAQYGIFSFVFIASILPVAVMVLAA